MIHEVVSYALYRCMIRKDDMMRGHLGSYAVTMLAWHLHLHSSCRIFIPKTRHFSTCTLACIALASARVSCRDATCNTRWWDTSEVIEQLCIRVGQNAQVSVLGEEYSEEKQSATQHMVAHMQSGWLFLDDNRHTCTSHSLGLGARNV